MVEEPQAMREVHEIMEKIYERDKGKKPEEILENIHKSSEKLLKERGLKLEIVRAKSRVSV